MQAEELSADGNRLRCLAQTLTCGLASTSKPPLIRPRCTRPYQILSLGDFFEVNLVSVPFWLFVVQPGVFVNLSLLPRALFERVCDSILGRNTEVLGEKFALDHRGKNTSFAVMMTRSCSYQFAWRRAILILVLSNGGENGSWSTPMEQLATGRLFKSNTGSGSFDNLIDQTLTAQMAFLVPGNGFG